MQAVVLAVALTLPSAQFTVRTLDGRSAVGAVQQVDAQHVTLKTTDGLADFPLKEVLDLKSDAAPVEPGPRAPISVELVDGSKLSAGSYQVSAGTATINATDGKPQSIAVRAIRSVLLIPLDSESQVFWSDHMHVGASADLIAIRKLGNPRPDFLEGVLGDVTATTVDFEFEGERIPVKRQKIVGMIYYQKNQFEAVDPLCLVEDVRGWKLNAARVSLQGSTLSVLSTAGASFRVPLDEVSRIDFSAGKVFYLSDLEPEVVEWVPYVGLTQLPSGIADFHQPRRDRGIESALTLNGKVYDKGLALRSQTTMVYRLPGGSRRFCALAGIDDLVGGAGNVVLRLSGDGQTLFEQAIDGRGEPVGLDLDVTGVRRLTIFVDYGEGGAVADHLDLCEARITR